MHTNKWSALPSYGYAYKQKIAALTKDKISKTAKESINQRDLSAKLRISIRTLIGLMDKFDLPRQVSKKVSKLTFINKEKLIELLDSNTVLRDCGKYFNVSVTTIRRFMEVNDIPFRSRGNIAKLSNSEHSKIIDLYLKHNKNIAEIASLYKVHYRIIYHILNKNGFLRRKVPLSFMVTPKEMIRMTEEGLTIKTIARKFGVSSANVHLYKNQYNIKCSSRGRKKSK